MKALAALPLMLLLAAAPAPGFADAVEGFRCASANPQARAGVTAIERAYRERSVAIVEAALAGDRARLGRAVAPGAEFLLWRGDSAAGGRTSGADAAIAFFSEWITPRSYRYAAGFRGPISTEPCGDFDAELTLEGEKPGTGAVATFTYRGGILTGIDAREADLVEGRFARPAVPPPPPQD